MPRFRRSFRSSRPRSPSSTGPAERDLLRQRYERSQTPAEIAAATGRALAAVEGGLADLRRRIREELPRASAPPAVPVDDVMSSVLGAGSSSGTPESKVQRGQIDHALRRSVERLSPADRQLYRWYYSGGLTPKWIAPLVGVTPAQISRKLFKMRRRLVAILLQDKVIQSVIRQRTG